MFCTVIEKSVTGIFFLKRVRVHAWKVKRCLPAATSVSVLLLRFSVQVTLSGRFFLGFAFELFVCLFALCFKICDFRFLFALVRVLIDAFFCSVFFTSGNFGFKVGESS